MILGHFRVPVGEMLPDHLGILVGRLCIDRLAGGAVQIAKADISGG